MVGETSTYTNQSLQRQLFARSERVKGIDFHPTEPWILTTLYSGHVYIWSYETQAIVKTFELTDVPVRAGRFIARKNWIVCGSDDFQLRVYNYNTSEKITSFEAHPDYIRAIVVHPTQPFVLTASDDMTIKLWDWERGWKCVQIFEGHSHYVMGLAINPKDTNTFASACLDRSVKIWNLGSSSASYTIDAHETKGVNHVDYYPQSDKPYLLTTSDDRTVKIWDYTTKALVATLEGHTSNVSFACYHPELPVIISGSEDGTVKIWHANTYRLEQSLNYGLERAWCVSYQRGSQGIAMGFDDGAVVVKMGREEPAVSMDASGKVIWARHSEILTTLIKGGGVFDCFFCPFALSSLFSPSFVRFSFFLFSFCFSSFCFPSFISSFFFFPSLLSFARNITLLTVVIVASNRRKPQRRSASHTPHQGSWRHRNLPPDPHSLAQRPICRRLW